MRKSFAGLLAVAAMLAAFSVRANLPMTLKTNQHTYMRGETVYLQLGIQNDTGRALVFGDLPELSGKINFQLQDSQGYPVPEISGVEMSLSDTIFKPGEVKRFTTALNTSNALLANGIYHIYARISHPLLDSAFRSGECRFEISEGTIIRRFPVGVPEVVGGNKDEKVKEREFSLRYMIDSPMRYYYVVLSDEDRLYQVLRLGQETGLERPALALDMVNSLHILSAISGKVYKYIVLDINGRILVQEYFRTGDTSPKLVRGASGKIMVAGGEAAQANVDYSIEKSNVFPDSDSGAAE